MDTKKLREIILAATTQFRKGEAVETKPVGIASQSISVYAMPHQREAADGLTMIDCHFITVGVDQKVAEACRNSLIECLSGYPQPERLAGGPSYIEVGGVLGDQGMALRLFALGAPLDLWKLITPRTLGITGSAADELAGGGLVMISGFKREATIATQD